MYATEHYGTACRVVWPRRRHSLCRVIILTLVSDLPAADNTWTDWTCVAYAGLFHPGRPGKWLKFFSFGGSMECASKRASLLLISIQIWFPRNYSTSTPGNTLQTPDVTSRRRWTDGIDEFIRCQSPIRRGGLPRLTGSCFYCSPKGISREHPPEDGFLHFLHHNRVQHRRSGGWKEKVTEESV